MLSYVGPPQFSFQKAVVMGIMGNVGGQLLLGHPVCMSLLSLANVCVLKLHRAIGFLLHNKSNERVKRRHVRSLHVADVVKPLPDQSTHHTAAKREIARL